MEAKVLKEEWIKETELKGGKWKMPTLLVDKEKKGK